MRVATAGAALALLLGACDVPFVSIVCTSDPECGTGMTCVNGDCVPATTPPPCTPVPLAGVVSLAAGLAHVCASTADGRFYCWGSNAYGQLGSGDAATLAYTTPVSLPARPRAALAAGEHSGALLGDAVAAWGLNDLGQLGLDPAGTLHTSQPTLVPGLAAVETMALGLVDGCAVSGDARTLSCWGGVSHGQLGNGVVDTGGYAALAPVGVEPDGLEPLVGVRSVAAGVSHTCAVAGADGDTWLYCWGANEHGQLGVTGLDRGRATRVMAIEPTALVALGSVHTCVAEAAGVRCFGGNHEHQIDALSTQDVLEPLREDLPGRASALAAGASHSCAVVGGQVWCWGEGGSGQTGRPPEQLEARAPHTVVDAAGTALTGMQLVAAGNDFSCATDATGQVRCWGSDRAGQLGDGERATGRYRASLVEVCR
jgi:alpha-tubulin suppressor-like RCC1 family protein